MLKPPHGVTRRHLLGAAVGSLGWAVPWSLQAQAAGAAPLRVVASFSILADMLRVVGGDALEVQTLVGPNADAHVFSPKPQHAQMLAQAELVVVNGLGFEGWMDRLVRASGYKGPVLVASQGVQARPLGPGSGHAGGPDPHAWQDLSHAQRYVENLRRALVSLVAARPLQTAAINARAAAYGQQLQALDADIRSRMARIAPDRRRVVSPHDAFGYFGAAYGVSFVPAAGRNSGAEASAADVARLIQQLRQQRANAVFIENVTDPRLVQRIAQEAGVGVGGRLYSDALSLPGTEADTYLKLYAHNANAILSALQPTR